MKTKTEYYGIGEQYFNACLERVKELNEKGVEAKVVSRVNKFGQNVWSVKFKIK